jgi:pyridoxamine 5'-phosphate oxidase-like protein
VTSWGELARQRPELAEGGRHLLYQHGVGLAFLATIRPDGGPRLHPFCPLLTDQDMFGFIIPSPKQRDLRRDGRYAVHSFPTDDNEDAFSVTGRVEVVDDAAVRTTLGDQFVRERVEIGVPFPEDSHLLVRFDLEGALLTTTSGFGDDAPTHATWHAS